MQKKMNLIKQDYKKERLISHNELVKDQIFDQRQVNSVKLASGKRTFYLINKLNLFVLESGTSGCYKSYLSVTEDLEENRN